MPQNARRTRSQCLIMEGLKPEKITPVKKRVKRSSCTNSTLKCENSSFLYNRFCDKLNCTSQMDIVCFVKIDERCATFTHHTSRWYHISDAEHFCNYCFEYYYREQKAGHNAYKRWRHIWKSNSKNEANVKTFLCNERLLYWVKCTKPNCQKWRELPNGVELTNELVLTFTCQYLKQFEMTGICDQAENKEVAKVGSDNWAKTYSALPLLKNSPAADFLGAYYSDGVGLCPTCDRCIKALKVYQEQRKYEKQNGQSKHAPIQPYIEGLNPHFQPFYQPAEHGRAMCVHPDFVNPDEVAAFRDITQVLPGLYLGVRNLIIALWNLNCKEWLTDAVVESHLKVRGLVRVLYCSVAKQVLKFLTERGTVNIGVVNSPLNFKYISLNYQPNVIVIGAGISGLAAARHLQNLGIKTTVMEARQRIGGRICDDTSFNVCIGKGAQIVTGVINNPITLICEQTGLKMRFLGEKCDIFTDCGQLVDLIIDKDVENHFNNTLDLVAGWRKTAIQDESLYNKVFDAHNKLVKERMLKISDEKMRLFHFHLSNLEYACGSHLSQVSAMHWDQNECYNQFSGDHTMLWDGYSAAVKKLAQGLDIQLGKIVKCIDYSSSNIVKVFLKNGEVFAANKVLVTVPLAILQAEDIEFIPALPKIKKEALQRLGAGALEKVVLQFSECFWSSKIKGADFFGYISPNLEDRGQFPLFWDMSHYGNGPKPSSYILMTYLCGNAVELTKTKSDAQIIEMCVDVLKSIFPEKDVSFPVNYYVTKWNQEQFSKMVYSYVKLGSTGEEYDTLAQDLNQKVFFAGEGTNRKHPQTVVGAYESGLREVLKILQSF
ncbi:Lysine-specific histone demethylase 1B [Chamberlinius hualienensis]